MRPMFGRAAFLSFFSWAHGWPAGPLRCRRNPNTTWPCARGLVPGESLHLPGPQRARGGVRRCRLARRCSVPKHVLSVSLLLSFSPFPSKKTPTFGCCNSDCLRRWPLAPCVPEAGCRCWNSGTKLYQGSSYIFRGRGRFGLGRAVNAQSCWWAIGSRLKHTSTRWHRLASGVAAGSSAESAEWSPKCGTPQPWRWRNGTPSLSQALFCQWPSWRKLLEAVQLSKGEKG